MEFLQNISGVVDYIPQLLQNFSNVVKLIPQFLNNMISIFYKFLKINNNIIDASKFFTGIWNNIKYKIKGLVVIEKKPIITRPLFFLKLYNYLFYLYFIILINKSFLKLGIM